MKWEDLGRSSNVEDFRMRGSSRGSGGRVSIRLIIMIVRFLIKTKLGRIVLVLGLIGGGIAHFMGYNPLGLLDGSSMAKRAPQVISAEDNRSAAFVSAVLGQTEIIWGELFKHDGKKYEEPKLVLFRGGVKSGCGYASSQTGPFYCPSDKKVYLDLGFFDELSHKFNAPGDFAQAYVIAHEVGHHVQNLRGTLTKSHRLKKQSSKNEANAVQVMVELQADCYSGVWAHYLDDILEEGDIEEALNAASAIGDDTLQKQSRGYVVPDSFTHGSSADRMKWFKRGLSGGKLSSCETGI